MRALISSPLGLLIGLSLGALGGGGSILAVPALVYAAGQSAKAATTTSLILVAITSVIGILPHWRSGRVRWTSGALFGLAGIGGSLLGSHWNKAANPNALLLAFSGLMVIAGVAMVRRLRVARAVVTAKPAGAAVAASFVSPVHIDPATVIKVLAAGSGVGLLTGFFGVGGGFVIVPALVLALRFSMPEAVGTSLLVITINSIVALATRFHGGHVEWHIVVPFTVASLIGVVIGGRLAGSRDSTSLQRWFVGLLFVVAIYTATKSTLALL